MAYFLLRDFNILPKKELHWSPWVTWGSFVLGVLMISALPSLCLYWGHSLRPLIVGNSHLVNIVLVCCFRTQLVIVNEPHIADIVYRTDIMWLTQLLWIENSSDNVVINIAMFFDLAFP